MRRLLASLFAAGLIAATAVPAASAQPLVTGGLVNVTIANIDITTGDILSENTVTVNLGAALNVAATICDVNVNVLAVQLRQGGAVCETTTGDQTVTITPPQ